MVDRISETILQTLVASGELALADSTAVREQIDTGKGAIYSLLVTGSKVTEEQYTKAYAAALGMPYIDVRDKQIESKVLDIIPESTAREHMIIAYEQTDEVVKLAMANPNDRQIVEFIYKKVESR